MSKPLDLQQALLDPSSAFSSPEEVRDHSGLDRSDKIELLRRWAYEESEVAVAEEEGMIQGDRPILRRVLLALEALGADIDTEHSPPTKHEGI